MVLKTFKDALETIEPMKADMGRLSDIWYVECYTFFRVEYGRFHRNKGDHKICNQIISQGTKITYKNVEEYVNIWYTILINVVGVNGSKFY